MATQKIEIDSFTERQIHGLGQIVGEYENIEFYTPTNPSRPIDLRRGEVLLEVVIIACTSDRAGYIELITADC